MTAPELVFQGVLRRHWEDDATVLGRTPPIHTGEYERGDGDVPVITITEGTEGPIESGGQTDYYAYHGGGKGGVQLLGGARSITCVAGSYDDLRGAGPNGENLNPKQVRHQMYEHAAQLLVDHQVDTELRSIAPGEETKITQDFDSGDGVETVFKSQFRGRYLRQRSPR